MGWALWCYDDASDRGVGRFLQADPLPTLQQRASRKYRFVRSLVRSGEANLYHYVGSQPILLVDPDGKFPVPGIGGILPPPPPMLPRLSEDLQKLMQVKDLIKDPCPIANPKDMLKEWENELKRRRKELYKEINELMTPDKPGDLDWREVMIDRDKYGDPVSSLEQTIWNELREDLIAVALKYVGQYATDAGIRNRAQVAREQGTVRHGEGSD